MPIQLALYGATGRLGRAIISLLLQDPAFQLTSAIARSQIGADLGALCDLPFHLPITSTPSIFDLILDVSSPESQALSIALAYKKPIVIGTTGHTSLATFEHAAREIPLFYAPNFSLGMALLRKLIQQAASHFPQNTQIDLIETHHAQKKDAPSGSALLLAKTIAETHPAPPIQSIRKGDTIGEHILQFNTPEERLSLTHTAHSRDLFARGALAAAQFLSTQPPGFYTMDNLLRTSGP